MKNLLARLNPFDRSRTIYLNADGTILTLPERIQKEKKLLSGQAIGNYYSSLFSSSDDDRQYYSDLLSLAGTKGSACKYVLISGQRDGRKLRVSAVKDDQGLLLGYMLQERSTNRRPKLPGF